MPRVRSPWLVSSRWMFTIPRSSSVDIVSSPGSSSIVAIYGFPFFQLNFIRYQKHFLKPSIPPEDRLMALYHRWKSSDIPLVSVPVSLLFVVVSVSHMSVSLTKALPFCFAFVLKSAL